MMSEWNCLPSFRFGQNSAVDTKLKSMMHKWGLLDNSSEGEEWSQYLYWALIPSLVEDNPIARNTMQALGLHRGSKSGEAAKLLIILAGEFRMPPPPKKN